jgi:hypothetical protein
MNTHYPKGFEIAFNIRRNMLCVRAWGEWDRGFGKRYIMAFQEQLRELSSKWKIWYVFVDLTGLSTQSEEVWSVMDQQFEAVSQQGMKKFACLGGKSHITSQITRVSHRNNGRRYAFFESQNEAFKWLFKDETTRITYKKES